MLGGVAEGEREGNGEDEDRGNGPLPGARVPRLRDITESRSGESGWTVGEEGRSGLVTERERARLLYTSD